ncbi:DUF4180 domain-containing protein [Paenibacillus elgii]|nr:DUF4180 domain-containing protein [Paenibacillus elgii]
MSITHAILGILSWKSVTGYDLKKIIQESPFMYWSANNNQIYKSLVQLLDEGFATCEVQHQESSPSKKIYTITEEGLAELKNWVLSTPEPPDLKKSFLIQLAWADQLNTDELNALLTKYEEEVRTQILLQQEQKLRGPFSPGRTAREICLWDMIYDNLIDFYKREWEWIQKLRSELRIPIEKEENQMNVQIIERGTKKYVEYTSAETPLSTRQDALDLIARCFEHDTNLLVLHAEALSDDFFNLKTGLAGEMLQKFINYRVKAALIITNEQVVKGRFKELLAEANKGNDFRVFGSAGEAEAWLLNF